MVGSRSLWCLLVSSIVVSGCELRPIDPVHVDAGISDLSGDGSDGSIAPPRDLADAASPDLHGPVEADLAMRAVDPVGSTVRVDREHGVEKGASAPARGLRDFDAHDAQLEQPVDEGPRHMRGFVHLADLRPDFPVRELMHAVAEESLVV